MKKITFVFLLTVFAGIFQLAKAQNIAHLNSIELLNLMPEKKSADDQLKTLADKKKAELKKQEDAFTAKYQRIQEDIAKKPQAEQEKEFQKYQEEFQKDNQNLLALRETAAKELEKKQDELYDPITKKAQNAVNDVAKAKGYLYVFDTSQPSLVYAAGPNILDEVKAKLGLK